MTGQLGEWLAGMVIWKGLDWLCLEVVRVRDTDVGRPEVKLTAQSAACRVWDVLSPCDRTVNSPTLRKAWKAVRNMAFSSDIIKGSWKAAGRAAVSLWRILSVMGWRVSGWWPALRLPSSILIMRK